MTKSQIGRRGKDRINLELFKTKRFLQQGYSLGERKYIEVCRKPNFYFDSSYCDNGAVAIIKTEIEVEIEEKINRHKEFYTSIKHWQKNHLLLYSRRKAEYQTHTRETASQVVIKSKMRLIFLTKSSEKISLPTLKENTSDKIL